MKKRHKNLFKILTLLATIPAVGVIITACTSNSKFQIDTHSGIVVQENNSDYFIILNTFKTIELSNEEQRDLEANVLIQTTNKVKLNSLKTKVLYDKNNRYIKIKLPQRPLVNDLVNISFSNNKFETLSFSFDKNQLKGLKQEKVDFSFSSENQNLTINNMKTILGFNVINNKIFDYTIEVYLNELNQDGTIKNTNPIKSTKSKLSQKEVEFVNLNPNSKYKIVNVIFYNLKNNGNYELINDFIPNLDNDKIITLNQVKVKEFNLNFSSNQQELIYRDQKFELKYNIPELKDKYVTFEIKEWDKIKNSFVDDSKYNESLRNEVSDNKVKFINLKYNTTYKLTKVNVYDQSGYSNKSYDTVVNIPKEEVFLTTPKQKITFNISNNFNFVLNNKKLEIGYELNYDSKNIMVELLELNENNEVIDINNKIKSEITDTSNKKLIFNNLNSNSKYKISSVFIYDSKTDQIPNNSFEILIPNKDNIVLIAPEIPQDKNENTNPPNDNSAPNTESTNTN